ncbi:unnamed protein product [Dibothriocephalus latus]|uniref:Reverse transcriptase domain-containing protein n=1 Tax=Dibothriocephalus latus TaxID=60516 RepID=A0A3P6UXB9_DIBLA|nr:unnamed protein product [Dibothriocephalus latus]
MQQLSSGKLSGSDAIPAKCYNDGSSQFMSCPTRLFQVVRSQGRVLQDSKDATILHYYKLCDNHRGISFFNITGKIFSLIVSIPIWNEDSCRKAGAAFALQDKGQEMRTHRYTIFVDLMKAFNMVSRDGLWKVMQKFGCAVRFTHMVRQLQVGIVARITDNGSVSKAFAMTDGVRPGCVLAPTSFSLMSSSVLMDAYRDKSYGI